jgi:ABC-type branched-subunit amino acid transport system ATPase component
MALKTAHRGYVLELGATAASGTVGDLASDPRLQAAYLGG